MAKKKRKKSASCQPSYKVSRAGHLLATRNFSSAGSVLSAEGKAEKKKRIARGCLNGPPGTFKLTEKQKRKLSPKLQKAIIEYHRRKGDRIID